MRFIKFQDQPATPITASSTSKLNPKAAKLSSTSRHRRNASHRHIPTIAIIATMTPQSRCWTLCSRLSPSRLHPVSQTPGNAGSSVAGVGAETALVAG